MGIREGTREGLVILLWKKPPVTLYQSLRPGTAPRTMAGFTNFTLGLGCPSSMGKRISTLTFDNIPKGTRVSRQPTEQMYWLDIDIKPSHLGRGVRLESYPTGAFSPIMRAQIEKKYQNLIRKDLMGVAMVELVELRLMDWKMKEPFTLRGQRIFTAHEFPSCSFADLEHEGGNIGRALQGPIGGAA
uniref:Uncharacterized protein n=1 Tax=Knipowitschia caucasica TaxID=637954 RepID=A0AAV2LUG3_KNICA